MKTTFVVLFRLAGLESDGKDNMEQTLKLSHFLVPFFYLYVLHFQTSQCIHYSSFRIHACTRLVVQVYGSLKPKADPGSNVLN